MCGYSVPAWCSGFPPGIFILGQANIRTRATVSDVTTHHNCFSGVMLNMASHSTITGILSVRNAIHSAGAPCGGNCLVNSHNNVVRGNFFAGNGSAANGNNDFGVGLNFGSGGSLIESNSIGGNSNGLLLQASATGNLIRLNVIAGNSGSQFSKDHPTTPGFDLKDEGTANGSRNTFDRHWCVSYFGPGPRAVRQPSQARSRF